MGEQFRYALAKMTAETMCMLWEAEHQESGRDLDAMMRRLKDLSAYSLTHAEILERREGVEMLAIAMFFGATSDSRFHPNQERLSQLSEETIVYEGRPEVVEEEFDARRSGKVPSNKKNKEEEDKPLQPRLF